MRKGRLAISNKQIAMDWQLTIGYETTVQYSRQVLIATVSQFANRELLIDFCGLVVGGFGKLYGKALVPSTQPNNMFFDVNKSGVLPTRFTIFLHKFCARNLHFLPLFRVGFYSLSTPPITNTKIKYISFTYLIRSCV